MGGVCIFTVVLYASVGVADAGSGDAQDADKTGQRPSDAAMARFDSVMTDVRRMGDWPVQAERLNTMLDHMWRGNGWDSESDVFARDAAREVTNIPPWEFERRMEKITELVADRYAFNPTQRDRFRSNLYRESFGFIFNNFDVIAKHAGEFVSSRVTGQPLTPEQIARWTKESESLIADGMARADRMGNTMRGNTDARQKELLRRDFEGFDRRMDDIIRLRAEWARGRWKPSDWGMQDDPIQSPQARSEAKRAIGDRGSGSTALSDHIRRITAPDALLYDESTWARYVRKFIERHALDAGQQTAIRSILSELESRAKQYRQTHRAEIEPVPVQERSEAEALEPVRKMFLELKARSEALLTEPQRSVERASSSGDPRR